jgi:transcriptional regulator with XRE-family HTH domain
MTLDEGLPCLLSALLSRPQDALTIARRVAIGAYIGDARVIAATPAAAAWYGMEEPNALIGQWLSLLHHPEDNRLARVLAAARYVGRAAPTAYVSRICQAHTPGTFRAVHKQTVQLTIGVETYWITRLSEPQESPLIFHEDAQQYFRLPQTPAALQFCGRWSVAEVEQTLQTSGLLATEGLSPAPLHAPPQRRQEPPRARPRRASVPGRSTPQTFGQLLQQARKAQGLSLRQAAARLYRDDGQPLSASYLHDLEHDRRRPSPHVLRECAVGLQIPYDVLLTYAHQADAILQAYLQEMPEAEADLSWLLLLARQYRFSAWERLARQILPQR